MEENQENLIKGDENIEKQVQEQEQQEKGQISKTFTQEELEKIIADRLERERRKYKDYDELKKIAEEYKQIKESQMTEQEKLQARLADLERSVL